MKNNKGFTIVEAIIVVAVLAAVTTMAFPDFVRFFKIQERTQEESNLQEIKRALEFYAEENKELPVDDAAWATSLARYSSLSANAIENDVWGRPRLYAIYSEDINFRSLNNTIPIDYAVVFSHGEIEGEGSASPIAADVVIENSLTTIDDYNTIETPEGDYMVKFTNYKQQIDNFETTEQRLKDISVALANFSTEQFNAAVISGLANAERLIYYPPSDNTDLGADMTLYPVAVKNAVDNIFGDVSGTENEITDNADNAIRKPDIVNLMRLLGLPDSHCCEATTNAGDGSGEGEAFYYYSNPKPNIPPCPSATRPDLNSLKLPPRISVDADVCG